MKTTTASSASAQLLTLRNRRTHALSLGERVEIRVSPSLGGEKCPFSTFWTETLDTALPSQSDRYFNKLLFYGSSIMAPFKPSHRDSRELAVHESV